MDMNHAEGKQIGQDDGEEEEENNQGGEEYGKGRMKLKMESPCLQCRHKFRSELICTILMNRN